MDVLGVISVFAILETLNSNPFLTLNVCLSRQVLKKCIIPSSLISLWFIQVERHNPFFCCYMCLINNARNNTTINSSVCNFPLLTAEH